MNNIWNLLDLVYKENYILAVKLENSKIHLKCAPSISPEDIKKINTLLENFESGLSNKITYFIDKKND